jgi:hypothetical protein
MVIYHSENLLEYINIGISTDVNFTKTLPSNHDLGIPIRMVYLGLFTYDNMTTTYKYVAPGGSALSQSASQYRIRSCVGITDTITSTVDRIRRRDT